MVKTIQLDENEIEFLKLILNDEIKKFNLNSSDENSEYRYDTACNILEILE